MQINACFLAAGFFFASIYTMMSKQDSQTSEQFVASLSPSQKAIYASIRAERRRLSLQGMLLGSGLALLYLFYKRNSTPKQSILGQVCAFTLIAKSFNLFYYLLSPKSTYMVEHLTSQHQVGLYKKIYREMQVRYYLGFVLGMSGFVAISYFLK